MKETRNIETKMRSWNLRQPSSSVKRRLFGADAYADEEQLAGTQDVPVRFAFRWLVPATAGFLLLCAMANPRVITGFSSSTDCGPIVAVVQSNQSPIAYLSGNKSGENNVASENLEWTNTSYSTSSIRSLAGPRGTY